MPEASSEVRFFGAPFDPSNSPEKLDLKRAYVSHTMGVSEPNSFHDPYDAIEAYMREERFFAENDFWLGKIPIASWLTPKPSLEDLPLLTPRQAVSFMEANGCWDYATELSRFVEDRVLPHRPIMIGVDHSLTGGALMALSKVYSNLNVVVLDAHFDVMRSGGLGPLFGFQNGHNSGDFYQCGNFLSFLLEREVIHPENLWVLGVAEEIVAKGSPKTGSHAADLERWLERGVHLVTRDMVTSHNVDIALTGPTYVSVDMDVGSLVSVFTARYMTCYGLDADQFLDLISTLKKSIQASRVALIGLDIMEVDTHFLDTVGTMPLQDYTKYIVKKILEMLLAEEIGA